MRLVGIAAAIVITVCSFVERAPHVRQERLDVLRLHGDDDDAGARGGVDVRERRLDAVPLGEIGEPLLMARRRRDLGRLAPARGERPAMRASPAFPAPRTAIFRLAMGERYPSWWSRFTAALMSARWVKACGKFPSCSPVGPISSEKSPRWFA